jgi:hypothetical protein
VVEPTQPVTHQEEAALRELAAKHRRRRRWIALYWSVTVSVHTTIILHTIWDCWPLNGRDLGPLAFFVVNALGGLGLPAWSLRCLRTDEAMERHWRLQHRGQPREGEGC